MINIDTSNNLNSLSNIEFNVKLKFIAVTYAILILVFVLKPNTIEIKMEVHSPLKNLFECIIFNFESLLCHVMNFYKIKKSKLFVKLVEFFLNTHLIEKSYLFQWSLEESMNRRLVCVKSYIGISSPTRNHNKFKKMRKISLFSCFAIF